MSLFHVQSLRKVSILTVLAAGALLLAGSRLPKPWVGTRVVALLSFPFLLWDYIWPRETRKQALEDMVAGSPPKQCSS